MLTNNRVIRCQNNDGEQLGAPLVIQDTKLRILIVDDERDLVDFLSMLLTKEVKGSRRPRTTWSSST